MRNPLVTIVVPTKNSSKTIEDCLRSLTRQTYNHLEIIVIDNNSTDSTKQVAEKFTDLVFNLGPERSVQRNFGVRKASGEYVVIIDSDMVLAPEVIGECVEKISQDPETKALVIPEESFGKGFWAQCKKLERSFYVGVEWMEAARFFDKKVYVELGGYDEDLVSGEDWDLSQRVKSKYKISRIKSYIHHNEGQLKLIGLLKKKIYYAGLIRNYTSKNQALDSIKLQTSIRQRYLLFFKQPEKLIRNPVVSLGMLFMKTCEFAAGGIGMIKAKI